MIVIGLTGGIGTGKSTVSAILKEHGCFVIDTDEISRDMTKKDGKAIPQLKETFGDEYFDDEGNLLRKKLGALVFADEKAKEKLERIVTQSVIEETDHVLCQLELAEYDGIVIVDAPLLFECGVDEMTDMNWLVTCDLSERIRRVMARDNCTEEEVRRRIDNQMPEKEKMLLADAIIDNSGDILDLEMQINELLVAMSC